MGYIYPTDLPVSSGYGPRDGGFHYGIDFSDGVEGHPIRAIADGVVTYKAFEPAPSFGNTVTITHDDGMKSGYGHLRDPAIVNVGDRVAQGQVIGYVGNTGGSTGPHLHLWMGATPNGPGTLDPTPLLAGAPAVYQEDEVTPEQMSTIGQWMKDTEARIEKKVLDTLGQWEQDTRKQINTHTDAAVQKILDALK